MYAFDESESVELSTLSVAVCEPGVLVTLLRLVKPMVELSAVLLLSVAALVPVRLSAVPAGLAEMVSVLVWPEVPFTV